MLRTILLLALLSASSCLALGQTSGRAIGYIQKGAAAQCLREDLSVKEGDTDAAMGGHRLTTFTFMNKSSSPCTLDGYPRLELLNRAGRVARRAARREALPGESESGAKPPQQVTIEPGKTAWFDIYYNNGGAGHMGKPCPTYPKIRITAPGTARAFTLRSDIQSCPGTDFQVSPVRGGKPQQ
ncbi:MAG: DUF4232 domain-containing protein [Acidobacteriota bacterium]|nr:DUF4232 domain-containing protein [Acidobacteriota bacterium]